MGVDIHGIVEIRKKGKWQVVDDVPGFFEGCRNYEFFEFLQEESESGIPGELEGKKFRYRPEYGYYEVEFTTESGTFNYGFGHITLARLNEGINGMNRDVFVSRMFLEEFERLGGVMPEGMHEIEPGEYDGNVRHFLVIDEEDTWSTAAAKRFAGELKEIAEKYSASDKDIRAVFYFDC